MCQEVNKEQWKCKTVYEKKCPKYCKDVAKVVCNSVPVTKCDKKSKMTCTLSSSRANKLEISERSDPDSGKNLSVLTNVDLTYTISSFQLSEDC